MKIIILILITLITAQVSSASSTRQFIRGLQQDLMFTKTERAVELSQHIFVRPFGTLGRLLSPDAVATYNDRTRVMSLDESHLERVSGPTRIKDARVIRGVQYMTPHLSTIFHEMGHAELDSFIKKEVGLDDVVLMHHYRNILRPHYRKTFSVINAFTLFHEHFGYYRTEIIDFLYAEVDNIFLYNGFNKQRRTCFLPPSIKKKLKDGISLEAFTKFFTHEARENDFYRHKINPGFIFVRGKDYDLGQGENAKGIIDLTHLLFWGYHQTHYNFPMNQKDFVQKLNKRSHYLNDLKNCRTEIWHQFHRN